jgi:serine/threonine-protein kinase
VRAQVTGDVSALAVLVDSLVAKLLVLGAGGDEQQAILLAGTSFPALQAYLAGQRDYRAGRYTKAMDAFARAVDADSTFAPAALGMELAGGWIVDPRRSRGLALAVRYRDKLGARDQWLLPVRADNRALTCRELLAEDEKRVQRAADVPELWYELGDNLFHCGHAMGMRDAWPRAMGAFERAIALDSAFAPAWEHIPGGKMELGDTAGARAALNAYLKTDADYAIVNRYLIGSTAERERLMPELISKSTREALSLNAYMSIWTGEMRQGEQMIAAARAKAVTESDRAQVQTMEVSFALNAGQPARAARIVRQLPAYSAARRMLDAVFFDGDSVLAAEASLDAARALGSRPPGTMFSSWADNAYAYGQYQLALGHLPEANRALEALRAAKPLPDTAWIGEKAHRAALVLDAQIAAVTHRPDAAQRAASADSMLRDGPPHILLRSAGNLALARLWELRGDNERAYAAAQRVYYTSTEFAPYWSTVKRESARLALATGDTSAAILRYREYVRLHSSPEPSLRTHMESVKRDLARLEKATAGR